MSETGVTSDSSVEMVQLFAESASRDPFPMIRLEGEPGPGEVRVSWSRLDLEFMGSKEKHWRRLDRSRQALVKMARRDTGEHWSEKLAAEVAALLGIPHPPVELGWLGDAHISLTLGFLEERQTLVHGNELLSELDASYPKDSDGARRSNYRSHAHTIQAVHRALQERFVAPPRLIQRELSAFGSFLGYLMFDVLIGNTDRHDENWGVLMSRQPTGRLLELAPSYDHASSFGRELNDDHRAALLRGRDQLRLDSYLRKTFSRLYPVGQKKPYTCLEAFQVGCEFEPEAAQFWTSRLALVPPPVFADILSRMPAPAMSSVAREFAAFLFNHNCEKLLRTRL